MAFVFGKCKMQGVGLLEKLAGTDFEARVADNLDNHSDASKKRK